MLRSNIAPGRMTKFDYRRNRIKAGLCNVAEVHGQLRRLIPSVLSRKMKSLSDTVLGCLNSPAPVFSIQRTSSTRIKISRFGEWLTLCAWVAFILQPDMYFYREICKTMCTNVKAVLA